MPSAPDPITSTPDQPGQPYDATSEASLGKWKTVPGPANSSGEASSEWEGGSGGWSQTLVRVSEPAMLARTLTAVTP